MSEKIYKAMKNTGALNIAVGIVTLVTGIASGILLIEILNYEKINKK